MTETKPRFRVVDGQPVQVCKPESKIDIARRRFGKLFAFEQGSTWKPRETPLLTEWMATRTRGKV